MGLNLYISNVGKLQKAEIKINGLTVISGENDTGKSTVGKLIYSLVKTMNTYDAADLNKIKFILLFNLCDLVKILGRNMQRRSSVFKKIEQEIFEYSYEIVRRKRLLTGFASNLEDYDKKISSLTIEQICVMFDKVSDYAAKHKNFMTKEVKEKVEEYKDVLYQFKNRELQFSVAMTDRLKSCMGNILTNSQCIEKEGKVVLKLNALNIIEAKVASSNILLTEYNEDNSAYIFDDATYIETPLVLNDRFITGENRVSPQADLIEKINSKDTISNFDAELFKDIDIGNIQFEKDKLTYKTSKDASPLMTMAMASGVKSMNLLKILYCKKKIGNPSNLVIVDEPENHLHPEWQVKYAELIVKMIDEGGYVVLTSHSPYLIEALYYYAKQYKLAEEKVSFYFSEKIDGTNFAEIRETKDLSIIFDKLSKPLEKLAWD